MIRQVFVYGESLQSFIVAIVVPDKEMLFAWALEKELPIKDYKALIQMEETINFILNLIKQ